MVEWYLSKSSGLSVTAAVAFGLPTLHNMLGINSGKPTSYCQRTLTCTLHTVFDSEKYSCRSRRPTVYLQRLLIQFLISYMLAQQVYESLFSLFSKRFCLQLLSSNLCNSSFLRSCLLIVSFFCLLF